MRTRACTRKHNVNKIDFRTEKESNRFQYFTIYMLRLYLLYAAGVLKPENIIYNKTTNRLMSRCREINVADSKRAVL